MPHRAGPSCCHPILDQEIEGITSPLPFYLSIHLLILSNTARGQNVSGGFAQSIALARIFVRHDTKILILDEGVSETSIIFTYIYLYLLLHLFILKIAMSQMDAYKKREIIYPRLFEFTRKFGIALIIITHDLVVPLSLPLPLPLPPPLPSRPFPQISQAYNMSS